MKRIRLGTALLVIANVGLVLGLIAQTRREAKREAALKAKILGLNAAIKADRTNQWATRNQWRAREIQYKRSIRSHLFEIDSLKFEVHQKERRDELNRRRAAIRDAAARERGSADDPERSPINRPDRRGP